MEEKKSFQCQSCWVTLAGTFEPELADFSLGTAKKAYFWSDGEFTHRHSPRPGSLVSCPECWAVFPRYFVEDLVLAENGTFEYYLDGALGKGREQDNSSLGFDPNRRLVPTNFKTWRMVPMAFHAGDPILQALIAESFLHSHNDRIRKSIIAGSEADKTLFEREPGEEELRTFVARVKNGMIQADSYSERFDSTVGAFFGIYRLYFLCAELSRSMKKFEWTKYFLDLISELSEAAETSKEDAWEYPEEWSRVDSPSIFWPASALEMRHQFLLKQVELRNPFLQIVSTWKI